MLMANTIFRVFDILFKSLYTLKYESKSIINKKINDIFISTFWFIVISLSIGFILLLLNNLIDKHYGINLYIIRSQNIQSLINSQSLKPILLIGILGPIFEETIFRLWLSFKKLEVAISAAFILFYLTAVIIYKKSLYTVGVTFDLLPPLFLSGIFFLLINIYLKPIAVDNFRTKYLTRCVGFSCVLFALAHLKNFTPFHIEIFWVYLIFVLPQFFMGFLLSYVRLKNGFIWALLLHCLWNSLGTLIAK